MPRQTIHSYLSHGGLKELAFLRIAFAENMNNPSLQLYVTYNEWHNDTGECQTDNNSRKEQIAFPICHHQ